MTFVKVLLVLLVPFFAIILEITLIGTIHDNVEMFILYATKYSSPLWPMMFLCTIMIMVQIALIVGIALGTLFILNKVFQKTKKKK